MHSNFRLPHRHTRTHLFHVPFSILFVSQSASASGQLCSPEQCKNRKKSPLLWLIKHEHPVVLSFSSMPSSTFSSVRFSSNPISNSSFWQLKMDWWKLCKCALFAMLFFCIRPHHVFLTLQSSGSALALVQKWDSCKEYMPPHSPVGI